MTRLIRWILDEYVRSQRVFVEWGAMIVVAYFAFRSHADPASMLATWSLAMVAVALYTTSVVADIIEQPQSQLRILVLPQRRVALASALLAVVIIDLSAYVVLVGTSYIVAPTAFPPLFTWLATLPPVVLLVSTSVVVMCLLTPMVATPLQRLLILAVLAIPMAWERIVGLLPDMLPAVVYTAAASVATLFGLALWPGMQLYALTNTPRYTAQSAALVAVHIAVVALLTLLAFRWYARKPITIA